MSSDAPATPRRVPALITFLQPFRIVEAPALAAWDATLEQINSASWDYTKLHEIVGGIDVGLPSPYHLLVGRDGALALPPIDELRNDQKAVEFFNRCLAALLLGGIFCQAVTLDHLEFGSVIDWKYIRVQSSASANRFHKLVRMQMASPLEAIELLTPRSEKFTNLKIAADVGLTTLNAIPELSGEFLLKGVSGIARRDWGVALSNLWITIEQLTSHLWNRDVISQLRTSSTVSGRSEQLADTRSWTIANRHELLSREGRWSNEELSNLYLARKARNDLVHKGRHPSAEAAAAAYSATKALLAASLRQNNLPLFNVNLNDHALSDPFAPPPMQGVDPKYWLPIPKLPGEEELEREEARQRSNKIFVNDSGQS